MNKPLQGRVVLVTGASSGIGRATCIELAMKGAAVALVARRAVAMEETVRQMGACDHLIVPADLADLEGIAAIMDKILSWHGYVDGFIHCAGQSERCRLRDTTPEHMQHFMRINCFAFVEMARQLSMRKKKRDPLQIVAISSLAARGQHKYRIAYAASKGALEAAAKVMAAELVIRNTRINLIRPAFVSTSTGYDPASDDDIWNSAAKLRENGQQPLGIIPPEEIAKLAAYLVGPDSMYSTGCIFTVNAGAPQ